MSRTALIKGWYSETLTPTLKQTHKITKASLINIDCDLYSSAKTGSWFLCPFDQRLKRNFFDDWTDEFVAEKKAFDEFLKENVNFLTEEIGTYKPTGKIFLIQKTA